MTIFTLDVAPSSWTPDQILNDQVFLAQSGAYQTQAKTGNRWGMVLTYQNLVLARRKSLESIVRQLQGRIHRLQVPMSLLGYARTGTGGGTPLMSAAHSAGARAITIDGATGNVTNWLTGQDYVTIGNELKAITGAINTTVGGTATLAIWPELHRNYADNTPINIATPFGVFMNRDMPQWGPYTPWRANEYLLTSLMLSLEEDVLA
jgi:hypothetical protein